MTVDDFIKENITNRILGAKNLISDIRVNDIHVKAGYDTENGIEVKEGIEHLAKMFGAEIVTDETPGEKITVITKSAVIQSIRFYSNAYVLTKGADEDV